MMDIYLDGQKDIAINMNGCSKAVARRAALTSATDGLISDIVRGMGQNPVNPFNATSAMGRGSNLGTIGESVHRLEDTRAIGHVQDGTADGQRHGGHRGTQRVPVYDAQGNLAGIRRVQIVNDHREKTSDGQMRITGHRGNANQRNRESDQPHIGKSSDGPCD